jgi:hypothetical protein
MIYKLILVLLFPLFCSGQTSYKVCAVMHGPGQVCDYFAAGSKQLLIVDSVAGWKYESLGGFDMSNAYAGQLQIRKDVFISEDSLFDASPLPTELDTRTVEVGLRFHVKSPGTIKAIRIYKASAGTIAVTLWRGSTKVFSVPYTGATGWNRVLVNHNIDSGEYTVSYFSADRRYASRENVFTQPIVRGPLTGLSGRYVYGSSAFPTNTYLNSSYGLDIVFKADTPKWAGLDTTMKFPNSITVPFPVGTRSIVDSFGTVSIVGNTISANEPAWIVIAVEDDNGELIGLANIAFDRPSRNRRPVSILYDDGTHEPIGAQIMVLLRDFGMW